MLRKAGLTLRFCSFAPCFFGWLFLLSMACLGSFWRDTTCERLDLLTLAKCSVWPVEAEDMAK